MKITLNEITVGSWKDLQEVLFDFEKDREINRFRSPYAYRGVTSNGYGLETSFSRLKSPGTEKHLLRNFKKYTNSILNNRNNLWELLAVAQHYGLPTRLLDWTFSPYVALHFATLNTAKYDDDGAIWCLDIAKVHELLPENFEKELTKEQSYVFTTEMLFNACEVEDLEEFDERNKSNNDFVICLETPSIDERIINQYAMFTIMSKPNINLTDILETRPDVYKKIVIPAHLKLEIRDKLDQANINERMIYPGLEGISAWLKRYYSNLNPNK